MPAVEARDTLGAGDVWHGAFVSKVGTVGIEEAIEFANARGFRTGAARGTSKLDRPGQGDDGSDMTSFDELLTRAQRLVDRNERALLGIAGAPAAGKTSLARQLADALGAHAAVVGMDGFHLAQVELNRLGKADRKGAPDTFDATVTCT